MSYDIEMKIKQLVINEDARGRYVFENGVYVVNTVFEYGITFNYTPIYKDVNFRVTDLDGLRGRETVNELRRIRDELGVDRIPDDASIGWLATRGNAGFAVGVLAMGASKNPDARWRIHS